MIASIALLAALASTAVARLDAETHASLLLRGRPQIGLWKALNAELKSSKQ